MENKDCIDFNDIKNKQEENYFQILNDIDVSNKIEKKNGLTYLSWTYAWAEAKKRFPNLTYNIRLFGEQQLPYVYDENTGYMVFTDVTINGLTHSMWLPVMDGANKAMKNKPYTYDTKYKKGLVVEAATMFDINKTIMRCLVKNLAMFGLGLYIYSGEDLPETKKKEKDDFDKQIKSELNTAIKDYAKFMNQKQSFVTAELSSKHGKPNTWNTETIISITDRLRESMNNSQIIEN